MKPGMCGLLRADCGVRISVVEQAAGGGNIGGPRAAGMHGIEIGLGKEKT